MAKIYDAIEESILDRFIITSKRGTAIRGHTKYVRDGKIFVEIDDDGIEDAIHVSNLKYVQFDIEFEINPLPVIMQLRALQFMEDDDLFSQIINNLEYDKALSHDDCLENSTTTIVNTYVERKLS